MNPSFRFLRYASLGMVYLSGEHIFLASRGCGPQTARRVGSLASEGRLWVQELQGQGKRGLSASPERQCLDRLEEFSFCVRELIPHCRFVATKDLSMSRLSPAIESLMEQLNDEAGGLRSRGHCSASMALPIAKWMSAPCAIDRNQLYPIQRVRIIGRNRCDVILDSVRYRHRSDKARPVQEVLEQARTMAKRYLEDTAARIDKAAWRPQTFGAILDLLLNQHGARRHGHYTVLYEDQNHQVQFHNGHCGLVRGPVRSVRAPKPVYVGLPIAGKNRAQRMALPPRVGDTPDLLWKGPKAAQTRCMGSAEQYRHLRSASFSDAEAFAQWLDAGVIVALGPPSVRNLAAVPRPAVRRNPRLRR